MQKTLEQYQAITATCRELFAKKTQDYGTAWRILRPSSLTDQLLIKAKRIRNIQEAGEQKIADPVEDEFIGIINYSILAIIQLQLPVETPLEISAEQALAHFDKEVKIARELMQAKNTDYGEVWRDMRVTSITDLILMKLLRIKQIEDNQGKTLVSEGLDANYRDIVNYAVFALILLSEK